MDTFHCRVEIAPFASDLSSDVLQLAVAVFGALDEPDFAWRMSHLPVASLTLASAASGALLGFKFGHALSSKRYPFTRARGGAGSRAG